MRFSVRLSNEMVKEPIDRYQVEFLLQARRYLIDRRLYQLLSVVRLILREQRFGNVQQHAVRTRKPVEQLVQKASVSAAEIEYGKCSITETIGNIRYLVFHFLS